MLRSIGLPELLVIAVVVLYLMPVWKIFKKLNHSGWLSLLMVVPVINIIVLWIVALSDPRSQLPMAVVISQATAFCTRCGAPFTTDAVFCHKMRHSPLGSVKCPSRSCGTSSSVYATTKQLF